MAKQVLTMREYVDLMVAEADRRTQIERRLLLRSLEERDTQLERRLNILNELRAEVITDRALFTPRIAFDTALTRMEHFLSREYYEEQHRALGDRVDMNIAAIAELRRELTSTRSRSAGYAAALGFAVTVFTVVLVVLQILHG